MWFFKDFSHFNKIPWLFHTWEMKIKFPDFLWEPCTNLFFSGFTSFFFLFGSFTIAAGFPFFLGLWGGASASARRDFLLDTSTSGCLHWSKKNTLNLKPQYRGIFFVQPFITLITRTFSNNHVLLYHWQIFSFPLCSIHTQQVFNTLKFEKVSFYEIHPHNFVLQLRVIT